VLRSNRKIKPKSFWNLLRATHRWVGTILVSLFTTNEQPLQQHQRPHRGNHTQHKKKSFTRLERVSESASRLSRFSTTFDFSETQAEMGDLKVTYYDSKNPGSFGGVQSLSKVADQPAKEWLSGQEAYTLHRPVRRNFQRRRIIVSGINEQWQVDLIDLTKLKKFNNGHTFVLIVIDVFWKFAWAESLTTTNPREFFICSK